MNSTRPLQGLGTLGLLFVLSCLVGLLTPISALSQEDLADREQQAMRAALEAISPSVVQIQTIGGSEVSGATVGQSTSSALVISTDGYLVSSSFNFARKPTAILVTLPGGRTLPAKLVATDHNREIALLKVDLPADADPLAVAPAAPRDSLRVGAWALAVGRMYEADQANVSVGIISALNRVWGKAIQTDAKVSPSNYGGPLVDIQGRVIGILAPLSPFPEMGMSGVDWYDSGIGFAVSLDDILAVVPRLKSGEELHRGLMGISIKGRDMVSAVPEIAAVHPRGPAQLAGVEAKDRILEVNGTTVINQSQLKHVVGPLYAGDKLEMLLLRGEEQVRATLELTDKLVPYDHPFLGILPSRNNVDQQAKQGGVRVRYVYPDSPAELAGIKVGDRLTKVNDQVISEANSLRELLNVFIPNEQASFTIDRDGESTSIDVTFSRLPERSPESLVAEAARKPFEGARPQTGMFDLKLAEFKNECSVYVPENYHPEARYGVVIWLPAPGKFDAEELVARWKDHCAERNLILLAPRSRDEQRWAADELEFIRRAYDDIAKDYAIDPTRVVVHGHEGGGAMAFHVAFSRRDFVRGVASVQSPVPSSVRPPATDPANRLAIYVVASKDHKQAVAIAKQIEVLRKMKYPVTQLELAGAPRYLDDGELAELVTWIDSLDRI